MPKKDYQELPSHYPVCVHSDCPLAASCLHQLAYKELCKTMERMWLINPSRCTKAEDCKYYRNSEPVRYARGFSSFQDKMYPKQYAAFKQQLIARFNRNDFYRRRRGELALPPAEQAFVLDALRKAGVTEEMPFDSYEDRRNWYD